MKNLIRTSCFWNPMTAVTNKDKAFELDNIIIYGDDGILIETGCGWFREGNNDIENAEILPEIVRKTKVDLSKKENFVVKSEPSEYRFETRNTLYIYYKNINYKFTGLVLDGLFLRINYEITLKCQIERDDTFEEKTIKNTMVIGDRDRASSKIEYSEAVKTYLAKMDSYHFSSKCDEFQEALKELAKLEKEYLKAREFEKGLTANDWELLIRDNCRVYLENNQKLLNK